MIKIQIVTDGKRVSDSIETEKTTLLENALVIRRLEEMIQQLLSYEYESEFEVKKD